MNTNDILGNITSEVSNFINNRIKGAQPSDKVSGVLNNLTAEASDFINNPSRLDRMLAEAEAAMRNIPKVGETLSGLPVMIAMAKSWIRKEYEVQPKVLIIMVAALLYLLKGKDIIPDKIPLLGMTDDIAVLGLALKVIEPELNAYRAWRDNAQAE